MCKNEEYNIKYMNTAEFLGRFSGMLEKSLNISFYYYVLLLFS